MSSRRLPRRIKELSKFGASYYAGLTIEADPDSDSPRLAIDGQKVEIRRSEGGFVYSDAGHDFVSETLHGLTEQIIDVLWDRKGREKLRDQHVEKLKERDTWNDWRKRDPSTRPLLFDAKLYRRDFADFNFCNANLIKADLRGANLQGANFHEANLGGAKLIGAKLMGANFCRTDLYETNLAKADLTGANLQGTQLVRTNFRDATLDGCTIYGLSAWNLKLKRKGLKQKEKRKDLEILYKVEQQNGEWEEGEFVVQNLELAQFVYLLLDNKRIKDFFDTMTSRAVVIMGRFLPKARKAILERLRRDLREEGYLPIVFDFAKPKDRDLIETIKTLVGLCQFTIVDITKARSTPLELGATVGDYQVPFVPILQKGEKPFSMFKDLRKYDWVLDTLTYKSAKELSLVTKPLIIDRALRMYKKIQRLKARKETEGMSAKGYIKSHPAVSGRSSRGASSPSVGRERR
jgi:uncharacterized protein YjbI with pentapeptide repeats